LIILFPPSAASSEESWSKEQRQVLAAMQRLSASTAPGGAGPDAYAAVLADGFSRWTVGSDVINDKKTWVEGVREWFDDGWRVSDRKTRNLEIQVGEDQTFVRRIVTETYLGPDKETSSSSAALAEVWVRGSDGWLLLRADVHPMGNP
jgi:hypothetical protein